MKTRLPTILVSVIISAVLLATLTWLVSAQASHVPLAATDTPTVSLPVMQSPDVNPTSTSPIIDQDQEQTTVLLWPKTTDNFQAEYPNWQAWLEGECASSDTVRNALLVSAQAAAAMIPANFTITADDASDLILVTGQTAYLPALLERLREHPLLARVTEDSPTLRSEAAVARGQPTLHAAGVDRALVPSLNIRFPWASNVVWGQTTSDKTITVTITRNAHVLTNTVKPDQSGCWYAFFGWDIQAGDVVSIADGVTAQQIPVMRLDFSVDLASNRITTRLGGLTDAANRNDGGMDIVAGRALRHVAPQGQGQTTVGFEDTDLKPGEPGFLRYTPEDGTHVLLPFALPVINIRRDLSSGHLPYGDSHSAGVSQIVWGSATPNTTLVITLTRSGEFLVTRSATSDQSGSFAVSMDRLIADGDVIQVASGTTVKTIQAPILSYHADPATRIITGAAPANITTVTPDAPHSLQVAISGAIRQVTTTSAGQYQADFTASPYIAGLLGSIRYSTPDGDRVHKPIFVADPLVRGKFGDWRADVILGQPDFSQITPNEVVNNKLFHPSGIHIDRSVRPNRVYIYDGANSRILGLTHLGQCAAGDQEGRECTAHSDCPDSSCSIDPAKPAEIVLGQPSFNRSACNGDSAYQMLPDTVMASPSTLCGLREEQLSILEGGSGATMVTDAQGNLYVPDHFNNRVLRYDNPFAADAVADNIWGQADFSGITCNRGLASSERTDNRSLCLAPPPGVGDLNAGVAVDSMGNLWVADNENNRILRFPYSPAQGAPGQEADLVLGQPDFWSRSAGSALNQMHKPASVLVDKRGSVYVADSLNNRIMVFDPPLTNGMTATRLLPGDLQRPTGLALGPDGSIWVNDTGNHRVMHFSADGSIGNIVPDVYDAYAGLGLDTDGSLVVTASGGQEEVLHFSAPAYNLDARIMDSETGEWNHTGPSGNAGGGALEVAAGQLIYADRERLLFWNTPWELVNYQPADGVVGVPDFSTRYSWPRVFGRMRADDRNRLWVLYGDTHIRGYHLPLTMGAMPFITITTPLPLLGGGVFTWTETLGLSGIDVQKGCDCLWLSDSNNHRTFRIRDVSSRPTVDIVLGQRDISGVHCNFGRDPDEGEAQHPSRDSLCHPGALAFDRNGNLYVADHNLEFRGNWRLLEFDAALLPADPASAVFGIPASRVFGRGGDFTAPNCLPLDQDPMCGPWEPTFDSQGRMVIGFNGYLGPRFPMVYEDPLSYPFPSAAIADFHSMPLSARFDQFDNLYVPDHNRMRVLIYRAQDTRTFSATGRITQGDDAPIEGVRVETVGYAAAAHSDAAGMFALTGLATGAYTLVPHKEHFAFEPPTRTVNIPTTTSGLDFVGYHDPLVLGASPDAGFNDVMTPITITGGYFVSGAKVRLDSNELSQVTWINPTTLKAAAPLGLPVKAYTLTVINPNGQIGSLPNGYTAVAPPSATIISPSLGASVSGMATITVTGSGDRVEIYLDDTLHGERYTFPATWSWSTWQTANGSHTLRAVSYGLQGRTSASPPVTINLVNGLPASRWITALSDKTVTDVAIALSDPRVLYAVTEEGQILRSSDGGILWGRVDRGMLGNVRLYAVAVSPTDSKVAFVGGSETVHRTTDGGATWRSTGLTAPIEDLAITPGQSSTVFAVGNGAYRSIDSGSSWSQVRSGFWSKNVAVGLFNAGTLYIGTSSPWLGSLHKTTDGGASWTVLPVQSAIGQVTGIVIDPVEAGTLYVGKSWDGGGLYKSTDGGASWTRLNLQLGIGSVAVAPTNRNVVYAGGQWSEVYQSRDGGITWTNKTNGLPGEAARALAVDPANPEIVYAALSGQGLWKYAPPSPTPTPTPIATPWPNRQYLPVILRGG